MAKTKNSQPSKRPSRGSASASPISPPALPTPVIGVPGSSSALMKTARNSKTQAQKSTYNLASPPVIASPIASPTTGFGDHDESHSSDHSLSKSSSSNGAPNVEKAMATFPTVSSQTRSKDPESEGLSDSSEEFVPKQLPSADDSGSESEEPEAEPVSAEPVVVPATIPKKDKGKRPIVSPSHILPQKRKRPSEELILENESIEMPSVRTTFKVPEKHPQGKSAKKKARSASPVITDEPTAAFASTSAPTEMAEFNLPFSQLYSTTTELHEAPLMSFL
ncbi:hypothetical protein CsatB_007352 [Cannabis sativa]|uniref:uncharacterized protein LOC115722700 n=1 Tax=Cannabis sativa TaxID=3483 RepID=UPI0011DFB8C3|nr:uncharacterized protein LOC115722700 [Cannabis sativa]